MNKFYVLFRVVFIDIFVWVLIISYFVTMWVVVFIFSSDKLVDWIEWLVSPTERVKLKFQGSSFLVASSVRIESRF